MNSIRITVVGDGDTGKTCMLIVYKDKTFSEAYVPTVFDVYSMTIPINYKEFTVILSDTAGQEEFDKLRRLAYTNTDVFILCFAVNEISSYENVYLKWAPELRKFCPRSKIVLAATKIDLRKVSQYTINTIDGERLAKMIHADGYIENSARDNFQIDETISLALKVVIDNSKIYSKKNNHGKSRQCRLL